MNNASATINQMTIKERSDGRFEGRLTVDGKRKSFYCKNIVILFKNYQGKK